MIEVRVDEAAYSKVARGLVKRVIVSLINQFSDNGVLDLTKELNDEGLNLIYTTAFGVLIQFEDFRGHVLGKQRHPVVVGFMSSPVEGNPDQEEPEEILISRRRTELHGGIDDELIQEIYSELKEKVVECNFKKAT